MLSLIRYLKMFASYIPMVKMGTDKLNTTENIYFVTVVRRLACKVGKRDSTVER